nr:PDR ABC-type transporter family protein [Tanacetum cinerariifolium]
DNVLRLRQEREGNQASAESQVDETTLYIEAASGAKKRNLYVFLDKQVEGMAKHKKIYVISFHTKKVFANMRRQGQGFSRNVIPLFENMMVNAQKEVGEGLGLYTDSHHTPTDTQPSLSKSQKKIKPKRKQRQATKVYSPSSEILVDESITTPSNDPLPSGEEKSSDEKDSLGAQEDASKQGRSIEDFDQDAEITLVDEAQRRMHDADMFGVDDLEGNKVIIDVREKIIEKEVSTADPVTAGEVVTAASVKDSAAPTTTTTDNVDDELTLAKTLIAIKAAKPKATIDADRQLAEQIQAQEREQLSIEETSKLLAELIKSRRKYFVAKRAEEIRNKPPTKAQQKSLMCTYMRNMEGFKKKDFKGKSFDDIKKMFDKVYKRVNIFVDMNIENVEESLKKTQAEVTKGSSKRAGQELKQERAKKQKLAEQEQAKVADDDIAELKRCLEIVSEDDDDVAIKATPLSSKSPTIVDYKIYREGKKSYFKIIRADGNLQNCLTFETMFKNFNREDLEVLRSIVKERFKKTKPVDDMKNLLFQTLKTMFEPHVEDIIWKYQQ